MTDETAKKPADMPPVAAIVLTADREKWVPLQFPVEFDGKIWEKVRVHRITAKELRAYIEAVSESSGYVMPPMVDCPLEVWEAMDADDQAEVDEVAMVFTPRRLKAAAERFQPSSTTTSG